MPTTQAPIREWTAHELKEYLDRQEELYILDVRSRDAFSTWKIEDRKTIPTLNVPYTEILARDDALASVISYAQQKLAGTLPRDRPIVAVRHMGHTSKLIAQGLQQLGYNAVSLQGGMTAWGDLYEFVPVVEGRDLSVYQITRPARGCLSYVIASNGKAIVIDPLRHAGKYVDFAQEKNLQIALVLDTHAHADHISGGPALARQLRVPYYLHPYDAIHPIDVLPAQIAFEPLRDGQELSIGKTSIKVLHIPGHTLGNSAYWLNGKYLFTGDSIFLESIARPDLGGRGETWAPLHYRSLRTLLELPGETIVLPGHFSSPREANAAGLYIATLTELQRKNEGLRMTRKNESEFVKYILSSLPQFPPQYIDIKRVNAGLITADDEKAAELELGRNVCALAKSHNA
jgi:glyoxylase-like metal-dependent hydrolase (beta-lactamase superfamily II)/rhodanese-related sulfurtransferase